MSHPHMLEYYSAEPGVMALDKFFHHLLVQGCCILGFYTLNLLHKFWYTVRTCSKAPSYHQLEMNYFL